MAKGPKQPKFGAQPPATKSVPKWALAPGHNDGKRLTWAFGSPDLGGPFPWTWDSATIQQIVQRLGQVEMLDMQSIRDQRSIVAFGSLEPTARNRLVEIQRDDIEHLYGVHVANSRAWFTPYDGIMYALWWDPDHKVYVPKNFKK